MWSRYNKDWKLAVNSYYGATEYRLGRYLKSYSIDNSTPSETINTYEVDDFGNQTGKYSTLLNKVDTSAQAENGIIDGTFYEEKLTNVPVYPYTRLYVSEYNSILFRNPPARTLPDDNDVNSFIQDVDGEGNSINEFMSKVDTFTTIYGVVWVSCIKPSGNDVARLKMHTPTDVTNWDYTYNAAGDLVLKRIVIKVSSTEDMNVYNYITADKIDTVFVLNDADSDVDSIPEEAIAYEFDETKYYVIENENELGYIPVRPIYQSTKIHNGVGHTPIFDIAQIQRSIYGDMGEIYSAVSYGSHPVNLVDEETSALNDGQIGAEPGTVIRVPSSVNGQTNHVFEFVAPPLDSISELRELIADKIQNMNAVAMIRSDDLIRSSTSGVAIEQYDTKLEAFVRKKATSLENAEVQLWKIWYDWLGKEMPEDLTVSYNRLYNKRGLENEINELNQLMELVDTYNARQDTDEDTEFAQDTKDTIKNRIQQLLATSFTENSL